MNTHYRTHTCGELDESFVGKQVSLAGWVKRIRLHAKLMFIDLGDRYGVTQITLDSDKFPDMTKITKESVISVKGKVVLRPDPNEKIKTGKIEVEVSEIKVLSLSEKIPIDLSEESTTNEEMRLKYRYLDLRRTNIQRNLVLRHKVNKAIRDFFDENGFVEVDTPILTKSTPEGARDYLVPSRIHPGKFYALPQSPQQFKQLLMVGGLDRYFQIAKCFRDEDLRADRQPEFTQIDVEMSFVDEHDVQNMVEGMFKKVFSIIGVELKLPFERMNYNDALNRFGIDKPDLRFAQEIIDVTDVFRNSSFNVFKTIAENDGTIKALIAKKCASFGKSAIAKLDAAAKEFCHGISFIKYGEDRVSGSLSKFYGELKPFLDKLNFEPGDLALFVADKKWKKACEGMGRVRLKLFDLILNDATLNGYYRENKWIRDGYHFLWIVDFPLFSWSDEEERFVSEHHLFTAPKEEFKANLEEYKDKLDKVVSQSYDIVLNGEELGSGSIRIHERELQKKVFRLLKLSEEDIRLKFGHMIDAFRFGAPPHGGIAIGVDRLVSIMAGIDNIRDVIAFPKNNMAVSPMDGSPNKVSDKQLNELHIRIDTE